MLKNNDHRVRNNAAIALCEYIKSRSTESLKEQDPRTRNGRDELLIKYVSDRVFKQLPSPLSQTKDIPNVEVNQIVLGEILYNLTNLLLDLENKDQQVS